MPKKRSPRPKNDLQWMSEALKLAARGQGRTSPNPMVGCIIVKRGRVLGEGYHQCAGGPHAEVHALRSAKGQAKGSTAYVNLEPCAHTGRTPPCTDALINAGVARVVIAHRDPNPLVNGKGIRALKKVGIQVEVGVLREEALLLNEAFIHSVKRHRPMIVAKIAQSLDGRIATASGESQWITSKASRRRGHILRHQLDAILVGKNTVMRDDPALTSRIRGGVNPLKVVTDSKLSLPLGAQVVEQCLSAPEVHGKTLIYCTEDAPHRKRRSLERKNVEVVLCPKVGTRVSLSAMLEDLHRRGIRSLLVEGGPTVLGSFFDLGVVDKVYTFIAPVILGGEALNSVAGLGAQALSDAVRLKRMKQENLDGDTLLIGYL